MLSTVFPHCYRASCVNKCRHRVSWIQQTCSKVIIYSDLKRNTRHLVLLCTKLTFFRNTYFSCLAAGLLSHSRLRGTKEARVYTTAQVRAPTEVRGACSGPPQSRILANNFGESFQPARAKQENGDPTILKIFVCCWLLLYHASSRFSNLGGGIFRDVFDLQNA